MSTNWQFRPNTQDEDIYNEVYVKNCYKLPDDLTGKVIVDIGANIGCFTIACLERGASRVIACEPDHENFKLLARHCNPYLSSGRLTLLNRLIIGDSWEGKVDVKIPGYQMLNGTALTGGVSALGAESIDAVSKVWVRTMPAKELIYGNVWLKLDCEGMEYQILSSDLPWDLIERVFGEAHDYLDGKFSRDTEAVNVQSDAFGALTPDRVSLCQHLKTVGFDNIKIEHNTEDSRLALFFAGKAETKQVAVLTPFRNARRYLQLYFQQIASLKVALEEEGYFLRLVAAEGDSLDGTRERIVELAAEYKIPLELIDTTHGHMHWGSVEDPVRMKVMSGVMNKALDAVKESDDVVVWIMSDLEWNADDLLDMILAVEEVRLGFSVFAPLALSGSSINLHSNTVKDAKVFYDTWAYRKSGSRFNITPPYHSDLTSSLEEIDSAGTCLVMDSKVARSCKAVDSEAVSFCKDARSKGYSVGLGTGWEVYHAVPPKYRLLWIGDAVCISGFSKVSHSMFPILSEAGYEIDIIATNFQGTPHNYPYRIWPADEGSSGALRMQQLLVHADKHDKQYDAIIVLDDPWNVPRVTRSLEDLRENHDIKDLPPVIAWVTVDGKNVRGEQLKSTDLYHIATSTKFGADELAVGGYNVSGGCPYVIPFGVDTSIYHPLDKVESRRLVSSKDVPEGAFIVGTVSTNQLRKRLDLVLKHFSEWINRHHIDNVYLYLCLGASNNTGCDILSLIRYYGLRKKVILNTSLLSEQAMAYVYNYFDVFISLSQGEGFGLCALEAMACGVPCVLSDWAGYSSWVPSDCAIKVPCTSTALSSPLNEQAYVIGGVASRRGTVDALHRLYTFPDMRERLSERGLSLARQMSWRSTGGKLLSVVERVISQDKAGMFEAKSATG